MVRRRWKSIAYYGLGPTRLRSLDVLYTVIASRPPCRTGRTGEKRLPGSWNSTGCSLAELAGRPDRSSIELERDARQPSGSLVAHRVPTRVAMRARLILQYAFDTRPFWPRLADGRGTAGAIAGLKLFSIPSVGFELNCRRRQWPILGLLERGFGAYTDVFPTAGSGVVDGRCPSAAQAYGTRSRSPLRSNRSMALRNEDGAKCE